MKKSIFQILVVFFSLSGYGQTTTSLNITFNHLAISVKDLNRSAEFYGTILNLTEISKQTQSNSGVRWFSLGEGKELHLISYQYYKGDTVVTNKAVHLALTTNNFDALTKMLDNKNVFYGDWQGTPGKINIRSDGVKQIFFQDPDGYWIEINSVGQK
jgi:catechol 2,3-dioxygenase-like lactoylglutathione lyase family enzyme